MIPKNWPCIDGCDEPVADTEDFDCDSMKPHETIRPVNAHVHPGCRVYHKGKVCKLKPEQGELFERGTDGNCDGGTRDQDSE